MKKHQNSLDIIVRYSCYYYYNISLHYIEGDQNKECGYTQ